MAYYINLPIGSLEFSDDYPREQAMQIARERMAAAYMPQPTSQQQAPAKPPEEGGSILGDIAGSVIRGTGSAIGSVGSAAGVLTGDFENALTRAGKGVTEYGKTFMSPEYKAAKERIEAAQQAAEGQGFWPQTVATLGAYASPENWRAGWLGTAFEQAPLLATTMGGGLAARAGMAGIRSLTGRQLAKEAAEAAGARAGKVGAVGTAAVLQGGDVAGDTYEEMMKLDQRKLDASDDYKKLIASGLSQDEARHKLATQVAREAGILSGAESALTGALIPGAERLPFTKKMQAGLIGRVLKGGLFEGVQEYAEEAGGKYLSNFAISRVDSERDLMEGVAAAGAAGAFGGFLLGGASHALHGKEQVPPPGKRAEDIDLRTALHTLYSDEKQLPEFINTSLGDIKATQALDMFTKRYPELLDLNTSEMKLSVGANIFNQEMQKINDMISSSQGVISDLNTQLTQARTDKKALEEQSKKEGANFTGQADLDDAKQRIASLTKSIIDERKNLANIKQSIPKIAPVKKDQITTYTPDMFTAAMEAVKSGAPKVAVNEEPTLTEEDILRRREERQRQESGVGVPPITPTTPTPTVTAPTVTSVQASVEATTAPPITQPQATTETTVAPPQTTQETEPTTVSAEGYDTEFEPLEFKAEAPFPDTHPKTKENGESVVIDKPSQPTDWSTWYGASNIATFTPTSEQPETVGLSSVPIKPWMGAPFSSQQWSGIDGTLPAIDSIPFEETQGKKTAAGIIMVEPDGRVWVVSPTNAFGGYENTFPKGTAEKGLTLQENALKEAFEESGLKGKIVDYLGDFEKGTSKVRFFVAQRVAGSPTDMGWESQAVHLVPASQLGTLLTNPNDKPIVDAFLKKYGDNPNIENIKYQAPQAKPTTTPKAETTTATPKDVYHPLVSGTLSDFKYIGPKGGSAPGGIYEEISTGDRYLIKGSLISQSQGPEEGAKRALNEIMAARLASASGLMAPEMSLIDLEGQYGGGIGIASKIFPQIENFNLNDPYHVRAAQKAFLVNAWLADWDSIGLQYDNTMIVKTPEGYSAAINIDPGGALLYRAQGQPKGNAFGSEATEIFTMRDPAKNPQAASVYGNMSFLRFQFAADYLNQIDDQTIRDIVKDYSPLNEKGNVDKEFSNNLANKLIERKKYLLGIVKSVEESLTDANSLSDKFPLTKSEVDSFIKKQPSAAPKTETKKDLSDASKAEAKEAKALKEYYDKFMKKPKPWLKEKKEIQFAEEQDKKVRKLADSTYEKVKNKKEFQSWMNGGWEPNKPAAPNQLVDADGKPLLFYHTTGYPKGHPKYTPYQETTFVGKGFDPKKAQYAKNASFASSDIGFQWKGNAIIPLWISAKKVFDYKVPSNIDIWRKKLIENGMNESQANNWASKIKNGDWSYLEESPSVDALRDLGFDAVYVVEQGIRNIMWWNPAQVKSVLNKFQKGAATSKEFSVKGIGSNRKVEVPEYGVLYVQKSPQEIAQDTIDDRLKKLEERGDQGKLIAAGLREAIASNQFTASQLYEAFMAMDVMAKTLPAGARHDIKFVKELIARDRDLQSLIQSGAEQGEAPVGSRRAPTDTASHGLITLALNDDTIYSLRANAAHEGFHVLQDYFRAYDKNFDSILKSQFMDNMTINDIDKSIAAKLMTTKADTGNTYWEDLKKLFGDSKLSAREAQAYTFGALLDAANNGMPLSGLKSSYINFINYLRKFLNRLGNALRGHGFYNASDVLEASLAGKGREFDTRPAPLGTGETEFAARQLRRAAPPGSSTLEKVTGVELDKPGVIGNILDKLVGAKATTRIYGDDRSEKRSDALIRTTVNKAHPFYILEDRLRKGLKWMGRSAGRAIELGLNNTGRIQTFLQHGMLAYNDVTGDVEFIDGSKSLMQIMGGKVTEKNKKEVQTYLAMLRERDLRKAGRQGFFNISDNEMIKAIKEAEAKHPEWVELAKDINEFNNHLVNFALDTGLIDREAANKLMSLFYTPFYRQMESDSNSAPEKAIGPAANDSLNNPRAFMHKLGGGETAIADLFENIIRNADSILRAGMKNVAMKEASNVMKLAGLATQVKAGAKSSNENIISFRENGKTVHYHVDDPVLWSVIGGSPAVMRRGFLKLMDTFARFFREAVTLAPRFMLGNLWRGKIVAYAQEGLPLWSNTFSGFKQAYMGSAAAIDIAAKTGFGGYIYGHGEKNIAAEFSRQLRIAGGEASIKDRVMQAIRGLQHISEATEMAERINLYNRLVKEGKSSGEAAWRAYQLAPFQRSGTGDGMLGSFLMSVMPMIPFLNAKIQGLYRLVESKEKSGKMRGVPAEIMLRGAVVTAFSVAAAMLAQSSAPDKWEDETDDRKLNYDIFYTPFGTVYLPRAFEVGTFFGAFPVYLMDAIRKKDGGDLAKAFGIGMVNTFGFLPIPAGAGPLLSVMGNIDMFRWRELENKGEQGKMVGERMNQRTSETAKALSRAFEFAREGAAKDIPILAQLGGLSPIKWQALLEGYLGTSGTVGLTFIDNMIGASGALPSKPEGAFGNPYGGAAIAANILGFSSFVKTDLEKASKFVNDFYSLKDESDKLMRTIHAYQNIGEEKKVTELAAPRRNEALINIKKDLDRAAKQMHDIDAQMRVISASREMSMADKGRQLRELNEAKIALAREAVNASREIGLR